jgi:acyl transferase domain-containing protein/acyl-CoA synthetase (AMP-forming)/AMP-acid ligase II/acyl carrier protein
MFSFAGPTLQELLLHRAAHEPDRIAYRFLSDVTTESAGLTYAELDKRARTIASHLATQTKPGDRALLLYPPGLDYITAFFGCVYAGIVAVPAYAPRQNRNLLRVQSIVADAGATIALTTAPALSRMASVFREYPALESLPWITTDEIPTQLDDSWKQPLIQGSDVVFLQYTSGSTGNPKGVVLTNDNLLHNLSGINEHFGNTRDSVAVIWLPPYHDMGLIGGVLQPLYAGHPAVLMLPTAFLMRPLSWLRAISDWNGTHSGGPDFAYDLCARRINAEECASLDLSSWTVAFTGAEPVRLETMERFAAAFAPYGFRRSSFYPCYGLAEGTLLVASGEQSVPPAVESLQASALENHSVKPVAPDAPNARRIVSCGTSIAGQTIAIVNPSTLIACAADEVGEIWVSGPSVASGYWNSEDDSAFQAYLSDTGEGPFLRTGDLGFMKDDELFVTGRLKDLIIIGGLNHYPQDIELTVETSHPALKRASGACFSIEADGAEQLVIVHEINHRQKPDLDQVIRLIRQSVAEKHALEPHAIALIRSGSIPKTSSGKIQRRACRAEFLQNTLESIRLEVGRHSHGLLELDDLEEYELTGSEESPAKPSSEVIADWLRTRIAERLNVAATTIDVNGSFAGFGLGSLQTVSLTGELESWLGRPLSSTLAYDYPTIIALSKYLAGEQFVSAVTLNDPAVEKTTEPIAIIGIGCRFPGAPDVNAFWQLLREGRDAITALPATRVELEETSDAHGGFLDQVDQFDPQFFGISAREALSMDPQQRLLLEVAWEAFENAGHAPQSLAGRRGGVFLGISSSDYWWRQPADYSGLDIYSSTGAAHSIAANRLSYFFDFKGPSFAVDTACSSSLVAVHLACASLRAGECNLALAGGVNLILTPHLTISFSKGHMLSPDFRCKTFDADANGYVRGEGCGLVVLKRLSDAQRDNDSIVAVIHGSAINQDGFSNGLTAPNGTAQKAVIREALDNAGVDGNQIGYVEAHGTGTPLGDPIEVNSLIEVLSEGRDGQPCRVGSVKTNIGHLEAAAGIAGLIKVALSLQHQEIPPHLHFNKLNPLIELEGTAFSIPTDLQSWQDDSHLAGVSSFGFGGTNCHVVLGEATAVQSLENEMERVAHVFALSAKSEAALLTLAGRYLEFVDHNPSVSLPDLAFSANVGRTHFSHRLALVAESADQLRSQLNAITTGQTPGGAVHSDKPPSVAFLFTGQGSQYEGMGRQLYESFPTFRKAFDRCAELLQPYLGKSLLSCVYPDAASETPSLLNETAYTQSALFALEYSLASLWLSWGIVPKAVLGHSIGEYVAACVAGIFSLEDAARLVGERGRLMQALTPGGEMIAVLAESEVISAAINGRASIAIAAVNGQRNTVVSGEQGELRQLLQELEANGLKAQRLTVSHAFHSPLMKPILTEFLAVAESVTYSSPKLKLISNVTGEVIGDRIAGAHYWCDHILSPVLFSKGMQTLRAEGIDAFIEIGPGKTLQSLGRQCLGPGDEIWLSSLRKGVGDCQQILESLAALYVKSAAVDWVGFDKDFNRRRVQTPTYPFQRQSYWLQSKASEEARRARPTASSDAESHPLLGRRLRLPLGNEIRYEAELDLNELNFLTGVRRLPVMTFVEIAMAAAATLGEPPYLIQDLKVLNAEVPLTNEPTVIQVSLSRDPDRPRFSIISCEDLDDSGILHATGTIVIAPENAPQKWELEALQERCEGELHGASVPTIERLWPQAGEALAVLNLDDSLAADSRRYQIHPMLLEACFQVMVAALPPELDKGAYSPLAIERIRLINRPGARLWAFARLHEIDRQVTGEFCMFDTDGSVVLEAEGVKLQTKALDQSQLIDHLELDFQRLVAETGVEIYKTLVPEVDRLSAVYVSLALQKLGLPNSTGQKLSITGIREQLGVLKTHERLLARLLEILTQDGMLRRVAENELEVCGFPENEEPGPLLEDLLRRYPACSVELQILARCGENLSRVLRGEIEPLQILFPAESNASVEKIYQESPPARLINQMVRATVEQAINAWPSDRTIRVLEIGAGTGSTTSLLLPCLPPDRTDYVFSDLSQLFLLNGRRKFGAYPFIRYEVLDIEQPPASQGFVNHEYDLVVAANVLHAAGDVQQAVRHVGQLLAPGGLLVMAEGISRQRAVDLIFGLLKGWWNLRDRDLRPDHPLLSPLQWRGLLEEEGFSWAATLPKAEQTELHFCQQQLIVGCKNHVD